VGIFSLPFSGIALLMGLIGTGIAISKGGRGIGLTITGSVISGAALAVGLLSWIAFNRYLDRLNSINP